MKRPLAVTIIALCISLGVQADTGETLEFEVHGMTCAFCVDALQRKLEALPEVKSAEVSLKQHRVRIHLEGTLVDRAEIRQSVIDAGFSPVGLQDTQGVD